MILWDNAGPETDTIILLLCYVNTDLHELVYEPMYVSASGCPHTDCVYLTQERRYFLSARMQVWPIERVSVFCESELIHLRAERFALAQLVLLIRIFIIYAIKLHRFLFLRQSYALAGHIK